MNIENQVQKVNVDLIIPNRFQPRLTFDENALNDLANSIKEHGIIQPLVLRRVNDKYEIIAGERRYKAACLAGVTEVPAIITTVGDNESAEIALVENVQRKNLNSMEEAKSYKMILDKGYLTQEALAQKMGISQSALANKLRLLNLTPEVQQALLTNRISERHARSLLTVTDPIRQVSLLNKVISERLTVRQLDEVIKQDNVVSNPAPAVETENVSNPTPTINEEPASNEVSSVSSELSNDFNIFNTNSAVNIFDTPSNESVLVQNTFDETVNNENTNIFDSVEQNESVQVQDNLSIENQDLNTNMFDNNQALDLSEVNNVTENNETVVDESIESLDILDDNQESKKNNIMDMFKIPSYSSLEDEAVNLNIDESSKDDDFFNPFSDNMSDNTSNSEDTTEETEIITKPVIQENKIKSGDMNSVKEAFNDLKHKVEEAGFKIAFEDFDFEDLYQIIIKIDKQ